MAGPEQRVVIGAYVPDDGVAKSIIQESLVKFRKHNRQSDTEGIGKCSVVLIIFIGFFLLGARVARYFFASKHVRCVPIGTVYLLRYEEGCHVPKKKTRESRKLRCYTDNSPLITLLI